jgi:hypothetical protein
MYTQEEERKGRKKLSKKEGSSLKVIFSRIAATEESPLIFNKISQKICRLHPPQVVSLSYLKQACFVGSTFLTC